VYLLDASRYVICGGFGCPASWDAEVSTGVRLSPTHKPDAQKDLNHIETVLRRDVR
jgi:hypothetical protein